MASSKVASAAAQQTQSAVYPLAAGLMVGGVLLQALPVTAAGLIFAGAALLLLKSLPVNFLVSVILLVVGAWVVDATVADLGGNVLQVTADNLPNAPALPGVNVEVGG